uniref:Uncharacterized protein n=1 Tax=Oryzias latipes TaxID=8090 RepID=A0A3P9IS67_ORYLA
MFTTLVAAIISDPDCPSAVHLRPSLLLLIVSGPFPLSLRDSGRDGGGTLDVTEAGLWTLLNQAGYLLMLL